MYTIKLPCSVSANQRLIKSKTGILINSAKYRDWHNLALFQIRNQFPKIETLHGRIKLYIEVHFKDKRRRDIDNIVKGLQDVLTDANFLSMIVKLTNYLLKGLKLIQTKKAMLLF